MRLFVSLLFIINISLASKCGSCDALDDLESSLKDRQDIYTTQTNTITNLQRLNANYLLHQMGINFNIGKEVRLIHLWQQVYTMKNE